jgi:hypothetical protein
MEVFTFKHPFTCLLSGPTSSGKTVFVMKLIKDQVSLISPPVKKVIYCYSQWQDVFNEMSTDFGVTFVQGLPSEEMLREPIPKLLLVDDLMSEIGLETETIFTRLSHHTSTSVILIVQNIFQKNLRTISLNSHYIILMKNPRDRTQINNLGKQMYPGNIAFLREAYDDATERPHGYLLIDLRQDTIDTGRVRTNIFPGDVQFVYIKDDSQSGQKHSKRK